jgi:hypothetical protein
VNYCFWNTMVPVMVGLVVCWVQVILFPETQYEYFVLHGEHLLLSSNRSFSGANLSYAFRPVATNPSLAQRLASSSMASRRFAPAHLQLQA